MVEVFLLFKQRINLYFNVENVKNGEKFDAVLLSIVLA